MAGEWVIPFKGRNATGVFGQNLLWRSNNVFVMDNHRAAAWCWTQCIAPTAPHALIHIDRHYDVLQSQLASWVAALPNGIPTTIEDYLTVEYELDFRLRAPVFRWDNYLSIYLELYKTSVLEAIFVTHHDGNERPNHPEAREIEPWDLLNALDHSIATIESPCILNIDLDFFFCTQDGQAVRFLDEAYFERVTAATARLNQVGKFPAITIALTATEDLTGGWAPAEEMAARLCAALGHTFALPG